MKEEKEKKDENRDTVVEGLAPEENNMERAKKLKRIIGIFKLRINEK